MRILDGKDYIDEVKRLIIEYTTRLGRDLSFQHLSEELDNPAFKYTAPQGEILIAENLTLRRSIFESRIIKYTAPQGEILIAENDGIILGMVAYHRHSDSRCEMKRLYVKPEARGMHLGDTLVSEIISHAKKAGYKEMVLDTITPLQAAISLYKKYGFVECEPYYNNPMDDVVYMKKML